MTHIAKIPVTVIGLGLMGQALAEAFLREGHPTTVWNRTASKADRLVAEGAKLADSVEAAVAASPVVVVCLTTYEAVHDLLDPVAETLDGRLLVNLTSGTPQQARETAEWAERHGGACLDGAIMAIPQGIGTPEAVIVYSGPRSAFDQHEPTLKTLAGEGTTHLGDDHGLAALHEVAVLSLMWSIGNGFFHGAALLGAAGVPASSYAPIAKRAIGTVIDWISPYAQQIDDGAYPPLDATLDTHVATMEHVIHESESLGVNADLPRLVKSLADRAIAAGHGNSGYAAMIEQFRKPSGAPA